MGPCGGPNNVHEFFLSGNDERIGLGTGQASFPRSHAPGTCQAAARSGTFADIVRSVSPAVVAYHTPSVVITTKAYTQCHRSDRPKVQVVHQFRGRVVCGWTWQFASLSV